MSVRLNARDGADPEETISDCLAATFSQDGRASRPLRGSPSRCMGDLRSKRTVSMTMAVLFQIVFAEPVRPPPR
jgi:hypothetical protein